jgi:hypothetical protein
VVLALACSALSAGCERKPNNASADRAATDAVDAEAGGDPNDMSMRDAIRDAGLAANPDPDAGGTGRDSGATVDRDPAIACAARKPSVSVGSRTVPRDAPLLDFPISAQVDTQQPSYFRVSGLTVGTTYDFVLHGSETLTLFVFGDDAAFNSAFCSRSAFPAAYPYTAPCVITATDEDMLIAVLAAERTESFSIDVTPTAPAEPPPNSEGKFVSPIVLAASLLPYAGQVGGDEDGDSMSIYEITGLSPFQRYAVSVSSPRQNVYALIADNDADPIWLDHGLPAIGRPTGDSLLVVVTSDDAAGSRFTLDVAVPTHVSEGTKDAPLEIQYPADLAHDGEVGWASAGEGLGAVSFYVVTGLDPGGYVVELASDVDARVVTFGDGSTFTQSYDSTAICVAESSPNLMGRCFSRITGNALYIAVVGAGDGLGGAITLDIEPASLTSEGVPNAPVAVALSSFPRASEVEKGTRSFYEVTGLTAGEVYTVSTADSDEPLILSVYADATRQDLLSVPSNEPVREQNPDNHYSVVAPGDSLFIEVSSSGLGFLRYIGTSFVLDVAKSTVGSEGTEAQPIELRCAGSPYVGRVDIAGPSHYRFTNLRPDAFYTLVAEGVDASVGVVAGAAPGTFCAPEATSGCSTQSTGTALDVVVYANMVGTTFELSLHDGALLSEGTSDAPLALDPTSSPHAGSVGPDEPSYYAIAGTDPNKAYVIEVISDSAPMRGIVAGVDTYLRAEFGKPARIALTGADPEIVTILPGWGPARFRIEVSEVISATTEANPLSLLVSALPHDAEASATDSMFYSITGLDPQTTYFASLSNIEGGTGLVMIDDARCVAPPGAALPRGAFISDSGSKAVTVTAEAERERMVRYQLDIKPSAQPEGTASAPLALTAADLPRSSSADCVASSFYVISGLTPDASYVVEVDPDAGDDASLEVSTDSAMSTDTHCVDSGERKHVRRCEITATGTSLYVSVVSPEAAGSRFTLNMFERAYTSEGTSDAPLDLPVSALPHAGEVSIQSTSSYRITGLTAFAPYFVTITGAEQRLKLAVYDDTHSTRLCEAPDATLADFPLALRCEIVPTGTAITVDVANLDSAGSAYALELFLLPP